MNTGPYGPIILRLWQHTSYEEVNGYKHKEIFRLIENGNYDNELRFDYPTGKIKLVFRFNAGRCAVKQGFVGVYFGKIDL